MAGSWGWSALSDVNQRRVIELAEEVYYVTACWWILSNVCCYVSVGLCGNVTSVHVCGTHIQKTVQIFCLGVCMCELTTWPGAW